MNRVRFAIVGAGWRSQCFMRVAQACPEQFEVIGLMARNAEKGAAIKQQWGVKTFTTLDELLARTDPQFVITSVPWIANPPLLKSLASQGVPVLSETPPAPDLAGLIELNKLSEQGARIQVAEQYCFQPHHAAQLGFISRGALGRISQAQISVAHGYHGISLMRHFLGVGYETARIIGSQFVSPLVEGPGRLGPPAREQIKSSVQQFLRFDFDNRLGLIDFTEDQYFSWIRNQRMLIQGERGEIVNHQVTYLKDFLTPIQLDFIRHTAGTNGNLEGSYLKGIQVGEEWIYRNPFVPGPLMDDDIAIATVLVKMEEYLRTGVEFYSLAEASQDHYLNLMSLKALERNESVQTERQPWAQQILERAP